MSGISFDASDVDLVRSKNARVCYARLKRARAGTEVMKRVPIFDTQILSD